MNVLEKYEKKPTSIMPANIKFSYSNCGPSTDPLFVQSLSVSPDPIKLPGTITVTGAFEFTKNITGPITVRNQVKFFYKTLFNLFKVTFIFERRQLS